MLAKGLQWEAVHGALDKDKDIVVIRAAHEARSADVLIVEAMKQIREREVLRNEGKLLAIDSRNERIDVFEMRPLLQTAQPEELTSAIHALLLSETLTGRLQRWWRALFTTAKGRFS